VKTAGLLILLALLAVIVGREARRVRSDSIHVDRRRLGLARGAELALWVASLAIVLPRLIALLT
jgi:hypothetical protein